MGTDKHATEKNGEEVSRISNVTMYADLAAAEDGRTPAILSFGVF